MTRYLIAKYIDDLSRNEPKNIGVLVHDGSQLVARFDGESKPGTLDFRSVRHRVSGSKAYQAWVEYWRKVMERPGRINRELADVAPGDERVIEHLLSSGGRDFYLERGGTILLDAEAKTPSEILEELFVRLVREPDPPAPPTLQEKSREALSAAGAPLDDEEKFKERVPVPLDVHGVLIHEEVSYAVKNGSWHYLQEMPFDPGKPRISKKEASHCVVLFEHSREIQAHGGAFLYDQADISGGQYQLLEMLMRLGPTINVGNTDRAAKRLREHLRLA